MHASLYRLAGNSGTGQEFHANPRPNPDIARKCERMRSNGRGEKREMREQDGEAREKREMSALGISKTSLAWTRARRSNALGATRRGRFEGNLSFMGSGC